jgi:hypothetical protein
MATTKRFVFSVILFLEKININRWNLLEVAGREFKKKSWRKVGFLEKSNDFEAATLLRMLDVTSIDGELAFTKLYTVSGRDLRNRDLFQTNHCKKSPKKFSPLVGWVEGVHGCSAMDQSRDSLKPGI